jgi:hypothetical protein
VFSKLLKLADVLPGQSDFIPNPESMLGNRELARRVPIAVSKSLLDNGAFAVLDAPAEPAELVVLEEPVLVLLEAEAEVDAVLRGYE